MRDTVERAFWTAVEVFLGVPIAGAILDAEVDARVTLLGGAIAAGIVFVKEISKARLAALKARRTGSE